MNYKNITPDRDATEMLFSLIERTEKYLWLGHMLELTKIMQVKYAARRTNVTYYSVGVSFVITYIQILCVRSLGLSCPT